MTQIGLFIRSADGFRGRVQTLTLAADLTLVALENGDGGRVPAYRIHLGDADGPEVGAAWRRTGEKAGAYLAVQLDDPALARPIRANLFPADADAVQFRLVWSRPTRGAAQP
ncbi:DUF736 domain-containing protein [Phenylobacterium sp.]|uniref:DUF736 domain-containing protein n=1 Tax=Phenylobacterium sp. TaxID=1871053 RepID=UPI0035B3F936